MRRIALLFFIVMLAGCKSTSGGPFSASRQKDKNPDPLLTGDDKRNSNREAVPDANAKWWNLPPQNLDATAAANR